MFVIFWLTSLCIIGSMFFHLISEVLVAESWSTLYNPMNCSPPGSSAHGILQARILEGLSFPPPGDLPDPGIEPGSPVLQADALLTELRGNPSHLIRTDSNAFLFYSWVTFHYVYASQFLYLFICLWTSGSTLAWEIPGTEEPGGLQSMGSQRGEHDSVTKQQEQQPSALQTRAHWRNLYRQGISSTLPNGFFSFSFSPHLWDVYHVHAASLHQHSWHFSSTAGGGVIGH